MNINLDILLDELRREYLVQYSGSSLNRQITGFCLVDDTKACTDHETLYLLRIRLRSLNELPDCPPNVPVLCVVNPDSFVISLEDRHISGPKSGLLILVYAPRSDDVLVKLTEISYRCGQKSSLLGDLSRQLLPCRSIGETLRLGFRYLGNPIIVTDRWHRPTDFTPADLVDWDKYAELCGAGSFLEQGSDVRAILSAVEESMRTARPVRGHSCCDFICQAMNSGSNLDGVMYVLGACSPLGQDDESVLELLGSFVHLFLRNSSTLSAFAEQDELGTLLTHIIDDVEISRDSLEKEMERLGLHLKKYHYILSIRPTEQIPVLQSPIHNLVGILPTLVPDTLSTYYHNQLILMIDSNREIFDFSAEWPALEKYLKENCLCGGVSNACQDLMKLRNYYFQSQRAAALGFDFFHDMTLVPYYICTPYHVLELAATYQDPIHFCDPRVLALYRADRENNTDLLHTLEAYLLSGHNKAQTAQRLFIHLNTVKYRLNQICEILPLQDLSTADEVRLQLSLMTLHYIHANDAV